VASELSEVILKLNKCRFCNNPLRYFFANLGMSPLSNSYLTEAKLQQMEPFYPLNAYICEKCFLVQLPEYEPPEHIFSDYAYFSSYSDIWLKHAEDYTNIVVERFGLDANSQVVEIASNDGYLLKYFKEKGIPVLGIEPAKNVANAAQEAGIPTIVKFFGVQTAKQLIGDNKYADLLIGNNVLAHVPNLNDFVKGLKILLKPHGIINMEFPHLMQLMAGNQFDTIYHEHFSYFSFITVRKILAAHGLNIIDVDELSTHGGSLRIYACHAGDESKPVDRRVNDLIKKEKAAGLNTLEHYLSFNEKIMKMKQNILAFMINAKSEKKSIVGYGAPAKGNTLLNYCGIRTDFMDFTVDRSPHKQNHFLPGTHIPIHHPDRIKETRPDFVVILPWNLKDEIMQQMSHIRQWDGHFVTLIPEVRIHP
jgi:2-polyprenyl-3-methyl-5-hydroxy-6-metoxy-1,4-benzoquinol methylase